MSYAATFTCQMLSPYQAGLNVTELVSSRIFPAAHMTADNQELRMQAGSFSFPSVQSPNKKHVLILLPPPLDVTSTATSIHDTHLEQGKATLSCSR